MAVHVDTKVVTLIAGEDLTGAGAEALKLDAAGHVVKTKATTDIIIGTLAEADSPAVAGVGRSTRGADQGVSVALIGGGGIMKFKAQAAITAGHVIVPTTTAGRVAGKAAPATNEHGVGIALEAAAAAGDIISVLVQVIE